MYKLTKKSCSVDCRMHPLGSAYDVNEYVLGNFITKNAAVNYLLQYVTDILKSAMDDILHYSDEENELSVRFLRKSENWFKLCFSEDEENLEETIEFIIESVDNK